jgi:hypothetical protein
LKNFYENNFAMMHYHKYSLSEIEGMMPWERHLYMDMLAKLVKDEQEKLRNDLSKIRARGK